MTNSKRAVNQIKCGVGVANQKRGAGKFFLKKIKEMKLPLEVLDNVFSCLQSEIDAEQFYRAVYTNGEDSDENANRFLQECEKRRWDNKGIAHLSNLPYNQLHQSEVTRLAARMYDYTLFSADDLPPEIFRMFRNVEVKWAKIRERMHMLRKYYKQFDQKNPWIWKLETKQRFEVTAQYLFALENLMDVGEPSAGPVEHFIEESEGVVTKENFAGYRKEFNHGEPWYMEDAVSAKWVSETDSEFSE